MDLGSAVQQVAQDAGEAVANTAKSMATDVVQQAQAAADPLALLEEILGGSPPAMKGGKEKGANEKATGGSMPDDPAARAALEQKIEADNKIKQEHLALHRQRMAEEQQRYQSVKAQEEQVKRQTQQQEEAQKKYQIEQISRQKKENLAVKIAQESAGAEKKAWGAG